MEKNTAFAIYYLIILVGILAALPMMVIGTSDNSTIDVTIQSIAEITVSPESLSFSLAPCDESSAQLLDVRNTGSENVSRMDVYVDTIENESSNPLGLDDNTLYAATGLLVVSNESYDRYYFSGRLEWNYSEAISNAILTNVDSCASPGASGNCSWGFIKNTTYDYMWAAGNGTGGYCNETGAQVAIEDDEDDGTASTRTPLSVNVVREAGDPYFSYFRIEEAFHGLLNNTCVALSTDCSKIYLYKYDKRTSPYNMASCTNADWMRYDNLIPGDVETMSIRAYAPCGIPDGALKQGNIYVVAQSGL